MILRGYPGIRGSPFFIFFKILVLVSSSFGNAGPLPSGGGLGEVRISTVSPFLSHNEITRYATNV